MELVEKQRSQNEYDARKISPPSGRGVATKTVSTEACFHGNAGYDKTLPEEWCDSGLDSFISGSINPDCTDPNPNDPNPTDPSWSCGINSDSAESDRLDSAIGDSINDDTVHGLSEQISTVALKETPDQRNPPDLQTDQRRKEEIYNTLCFLSEDGDTALHLALIHEQWDFFQQLLELVVLNPNWTPYLDIQNDLGQSALHLAAVLGSSESICALLKAGASVDLQERGGNTALHLAVNEQHSDCVRQITTSPRNLPEHLNCYNYTGVSALHLAVQKGKCDIISMLLEAGADVNKKDQGSGRSPLHWAVEYQNCAAVKLLLKFGANVNQRSYPGHTPLYCALYRSSIHLQDLLRMSGALELHDMEDEDEEDEVEEDDGANEEEEFDDVIINGKRVL